MTAGPALWRGPDLRHQVCPGLPRHVPPLQRLQVRLPPRTPLRLLDPPIFQAPRLGHGPRLQDRRALQVRLHRDRPGGAGLPRPLCHLDCRDVKDMSSSDVDSSVECMRRVQTNSLNGD